MLKGEHTYGGDGLLIRRWTCHDNVVCGKFCSIANSLTVYTDGNHRYDTFSTYPFREMLGFDCPPNCQGKGAPVIGNDVWIGDHVTIYSGSVIGDGAVLGGNSVVAGYIPPYAIACGNPARVTKYRFSEEQIKDLLELKWWDLPLETIKTRLIPHISNIDQVIDELKAIREEANSCVDVQEN